LYWRAGRWWKEAQVAAVVGEELRLLEPEMAQFETRLRATSAKENFKPHFFYGKAEELRELGPSYYPFC
jgi:hypothetical protein